MRATCDVGGSGDAQADLRKLKEKTGQWNCLFLRHPWQYLESRLARVRGPTTSLAYFFFPAGGAWKHDLVELVGKTAKSPDATELMLKHHETDDLEKEVHARLDMLFDVLLEILSHRVWSQAQRSEAPPRAFCKLLSPTPAVATGGKDALLAQWKHWK